MADPKPTDSRCEQLLNIGNSLFSDKTGYDSLCQEIAEHCHPLRTDYTTEHNLGADFSSGLMDSTPVMARETLGNAIESMLRQGEWFKLGTGDEDRDKKAANAIALDRGTRAISSIITDERTGFAAATKELDMDWVAFGQNVYSWETGMDEFNRTHLVLRAWHPKNVAWLMDEHGRVEVVFRKFRLSARDYKAKITNKRWKGKLPEVVETAAKDKPQQKFNLMHVLMPSDMVYATDGPKLREIGGKYCSVYIDTDNREYLNEDGVHVFNYGVSRCRTVTGTPWGYSPMAINSLSDMRMLQNLAMIMLEQGEKALDPPTLGAQEIFTRDLNFMAGGHTAVDLPDDRKLQDVFATLETTRNYGVGVEMKADVRALIAEAWLLNKLFLPNLRDMRELEVMVRTEEFRRAALPFFSPIESAYHSPMLGMAFQMAVNLKIIRPEMFPEELFEADVKFKFTSPLNEAEGQKTVAAHDALIQRVATAAQTDQTVANMFDFREATLDAVRGIPGAKPTWILSEKQRKTKDQEAAQAKQLEQAAAISRGGAAVVQDVAGAQMAAQQAGMT